MAAKLLSEDEKSAVLAHVAQNQSGTESREFKRQHLTELLFDVQFWLLALMTALPSISSGVVTTYSAILMIHIGFKPDAAALLNMPSGVVSIPSLPVLACDTAKLENAGSGFCSAVSLARLVEGPWLFSPRSHRMRTRPGC